MVKVKKTEYPNLVDLVITRIACSASNINAILDILNMGNVIAILETLSTDMQL